MEANRYVHGDALEVLRTLPDQSVQMCCTSPPYWGLRDYGHDGQIGLEETPAEYVAKLVAVFAEVRRVLRDDGTLWVNLGDSYSAGGSEPSPKHVAVNTGAKPRTPEMSGLRPKNLVGIPWRVAFALQADGWYLRSDIIWAKPNPMPESVTDRPTKAHEYVFLLSKSRRYHYDADAIKEKATPQKRTGEPSYRCPKDDGAFPGGPQKSAKTTLNGPSGDTRNKRTIWTVPSRPYHGAHFACWPPDLVKPMIMAGCPETTCGECGAPWVRQTERTPMVVRPSATRAAWQASDKHAQTQTGGTMTQAPSSRTVGWAPTCDHESRGPAGIVLDPFFGSGTTGRVAEDLGRRWFGIELNPDYGKLIDARTAQVGLL